MADRITIFHKETGSPLEVFNVDATELIASGEYSEEYVEPTQGGNSQDDSEDAKAKRERIKAELDALQVNYNKSLATDKLEALLNEAKAAAGQE